MLKEDVIEDILNVLIENYLQELPEATEIPDFGQKFESVSSQTKGRATTIFLQYSIDTWTPFICSPNDITYKGFLPQSVTRKSMR
jgi:hypothetical protein